MKTHKVRVALWIWHRTSDLGIAGSSPVTVDPFVFRVFCFVVNGLKKKISAIKLMVPNERKASLLFCHLN